MDTDTSELKEKGRPAGLVKSSPVSPVSYIFGLHAGDDKIVYVGVSSQPPSTRLAVFRSPSSIASGQPNRRTSEWVQRHLASAQTKVLAVLHEASSEERRNTQLEWISKLSSEGHSLLNSEIAGVIDKRTNKKQAAELAGAIAKMKPSKSELLAVLTDSIAVRNVFGVINPGLVSLVPKHVQWHIRRNLRDIDCVLCSNESDAWKVQATPFATKESQRKRAATLPPAAQPQSQAAADDVDEYDGQAQQTPATVRAISAEPAAQSVQLIGVEAHAGTLDDLGFEPDGEVDSSGRLRLIDTGAVDEATVPAPAAAEREQTSRVVVQSSETIGAIAQRVAASKRAVESESPQKTKRETSLENALKDVLKELAFLVEFIENELD